MISDGSIRSTQARSLRSMCVDQVRVPEPVQVRPLAVELDLGQVPAPVAVVADVQRLMDVLDEVDQEQQGALSFASGAARSARTLR